MRQKKQHCATIDTSSQAYQSKNNYPYTPSTIYASLTDKYSRSDLNTTPQNISQKSPKHCSRTIRINRQSISPLKSPDKTYLGHNRTANRLYFEQAITKQESDKKVKELQSWNNRKELKRLERVIKAREDQRKYLKQKPQIGQGSKQIYKELQQKKQLSNNIVQRFVQYEHEKVQMLIDNIICTHIQETNTVPTLRNLIRSNKSELVSLLRCYSKEELKHKNT